MYTIAQTPLDTHHHAHRPAVTTHDVNRPASSGGVGTAQMVTYRRPTLSAREIEVLLAWLRSDSKTRAAHELHISVGTINTHVTRIRHKYEGVGRPAPTKAGLFARALQDGFTSIEDW